MNKKNIQPVLVCASSAEQPVLKNVILNYSRDAVFCRDIQDLCHKLSDQVDALIIDESLLDPDSILILSKALQDQPEWSDLPVLLTTPDAVNPDLIQLAQKELGNVYLAAVAPAGIDAMLHNALRSRDRQRHDRDLAEEFVKLMQDLQNARRNLEEKVRERTLKLSENASQLRRLTGELILAEQKERRRLSGILHDQLQQLLVSAKYRMASLTRAEDATIKLAAQEVEELIGEVIEATRSLTSELSPPIIHESGFKEGMDWLVQFMAAKYGLVIRLKMEDAFSQLDENTKVILFEAVRELFSNLVKHSRMRSAELQINQTDGCLQMKAVDKSGALDPQKIKDAEFGIFKISERLTPLGGHVEIQNPAGKNLGIILRAPYIVPQSAGQPIPAAAEYGPQSESTIARSDKPVGSVIRVLIADDHAVMRQGLAAQLSQEPDIVIIGEAADGQAAMEKARELRPDVILMDIGMPKMNGIESTRSIHSEMPEIQVIGLSVYDEKERASEMFSAGAVAYLSKSCSVHELKNLMRRYTGKPKLPAVRR
jgi:signal transduction histidine kinase/ActR/RegA family two-component response regulator